MTDRDDFLAWVQTALYEAEVALHNGHAGPRRAIWSRNEPVSVLGALRSACGQQEVAEIRATQVYRREGGEWKVAHRHADGLTD